MINYRREIDGLRAIAVLSVILYHAAIEKFGIAWFEGGYIGVDIFFVISGYLITRIILIELNETNRFSFLNFYERRARRILPMLIFIITASLLVAWDILIPLALEEFSKSAISALAFSSNFFFYFSTTGYGAESSQLMPLLHTWSLGVEEQFYFIIPILLLLTWRFSKKYILSILLILAILSLQFADLMSFLNRDLNFYLPFSRVWELLVGSVIAYIEINYGIKRTTFLSNILPVIGLFLISHSIIFFDGGTLHPSFSTLIPIIGVSLIICYSSSNDLVGKILSSKPLVSIGLISYSAYLWHFPIFAISRITSLPNNPSNFSMLGLVLVTLILATITYFLIEKPFRNRVNMGTKSFLLILLTALIILSSLNFLIIKNNGYSNRSPEILQNNITDNIWENFKQDNKMCYERKSDFCSIQNSENFVDVFTLGDSALAAMSETIVKALNNKYNYLEANLGACPMILNVNRYDYHGIEGELCTAEIQNRRIAQITKKPSIVIIGGRFPLYLSSFFFDNEEGGVEGGYWKKFKSINEGKSFEDEFLSTMQKLIKDGHHVVMIYPIPEVGVNVSQHIFSQITGKSISAQKNTNFKLLTTSYDVFKERTKSTFDLFDLLESNQIYRVYPHTLFCNNQIEGRCVTHNQNEIYYVDSHHPSTKGSEMITKLLMEQIEIAEKNIRN